ncbi:MAG: polysaccharide deacetylase family protein [Oculatellaceae cyanobacterium Prado106]|nr:polysaccharide deacetylase family protein [Oculatellaceae cyanobacterium Prado106]
MPKLKALSLAVRSPQIHDRARSAKVPVMMYHDVLPEKEVFFDITPQELEAEFRKIQEQGLTPVSMDELVMHLKTGIPLPEKPVLLSFDDGYEGHYLYVYPLLRQFQYPAVFGIYTDKVGKRMGRSSLTWEQLQEMASDPLVTIASHTLSHSDLTQLFGDKLDQELVESKRILETELGVPIRYFVYPEGKFDERVTARVEAAGYQAALIMRNAEGKYAGESEDLMTIERFGMSELEGAIAQANGGLALPVWGDRLVLNAPIELNSITVDDIPLVMVQGGRPVTIHAKSRYRVHEIIAKTNLVAAVDGGFFSLEFLDSNTVIGPVLSQSTQQFVPGKKGENPLLAGRPLVLISPQQVRFVPFDPERHNALAGIQRELGSVTDAFVAAAWLVKDSQPQTAASFGNLYGFDYERDRAFWGIDQQGRPVVGITHAQVDSVRLGQLLSQSGLREAVMLDSGASTDLAFEGRSLGVFEARPVPHVVGLVAPQPGLGCK